MQLFDNNGFTRDRCYDFLNIFAENLKRKNWCFWLKTKVCKLCNILIITLFFFWQKSQFFFAENWRKSQKIVTITSVPVVMQWFDNNGFTKTLDRIFATLTRKTAIVANRFSKHFSQSGRNTWTKIIITFTCRVEWKLFILLIRFGSTQQNKWVCT
jgi:hypothetical protein